MQADNDIAAHKRQFNEFFTHEENKTDYDSKIRQMISDQRLRLIVNINHIRNFDADFATEIQNRPREYIIALQEAIAERARAIDSVLVEKLLKTNEIQVGFEGSFGTHAVSPRGLLSNLLNKLVVVEGIVTKCSSVRPKLVRSVHFCPATNSHYVKEYRDATDLDIGIAKYYDSREKEERVRLPTSSAFPTADKDGNPLELEHGLSMYKDYQTVVLQEMPERARVGQLPRSIELILQHDLVDRIKPGDRAQCVGVYRPLANMQNGHAQGVFRSVVMCNNVSVIGKEVGAVRLTGTDVGHIREVSEKPGLLDILARSFCPSIFGHEFVKKALILQLLGGCERNLSNGTHLRGDINVMMVGDPSTAKSQLLRAVMDIAPLAISTTGRGSSGVGLTAAVTSDAETGERRLEAGAMVLADRGIVCIDEFDKMSENDRVAIHEVMEQQTVTIAKAGIHASLNARCSVVAAANPIYGQYDRTERPQKNIGLPDSLLSRFDLLFIVLDQLDPVLDRRLSEHVIRSHQYRRPGSTMEPEPLDQSASLLTDFSAEAPKETAVWQRGGRGSERSTGSGSAGDVLTKDFLRKYIHYARNRVKPELTSEAMESISSAYADMRSKQTPKNLPVTARSLETIIRLATAHAKSRLSNVVEEFDVEEVLELINFVLFHEVGDFRSEEEGASMRKRPRTEGPEVSTEETESEVLTESEVVRENGMFTVDRESTRYRTVQDTVMNIGRPSEPIAVDAVYTRLTADTEPAGGRFSRAELIAILNDMEMQNKIMLDDDEVHII